MANRRIKFIGAWFMAFGVCVGLLLGWLLVRGCCGI